MFNRALYDKTLYDRTQGHESVTTFIQGSSSLKVGIVVQIFIDSFNLQGLGILESTSVTRQFFSADMVGKSEMIPSVFYFWDVFSGAFSGSGDALFGVLAKIPIGDLVSNGIGHILELTLFFYQHMRIDLAGRGDFYVAPVLRIPIAFDVMSGSGEMTINNRFNLLMTIKGLILGSGDIILHRIGALNSEFMEFNNLNLQPGQTMIVDTDELDVFIDNILNVNSITEDSVFFQLIPGENAISFSTNGNTNLQVTVIWQNRWL